MESYNSFCLNLNISFHFSRGRKSLIIVYYCSPFIMNFRFRPEIWVSGVGDLTA